VATKLVELNDGILVEIEVRDEDVEPISGKLAERIDASLDAIQPVLLRICRPIVAIWKEINQEMHIEQTEIELGLSFEGEGNLYITKAKAGANLTVKLVFKPPEV
jgi:hypothetical protein